MNKPEVLRFYESCLSMRRIDQAGRPPESADLLMRAVRLGKLCRGGPSEYSQRNAAGVKNTNP